MFPSGSTLFDKIPDWHNIFQHSYSLVRCSVRVVPCLVGPVPKSRDTKQRRAYIFSIYLRPWTWSCKLDDSDVLHVDALGLVPPVVRKNWKEYLETFLDDSGCEILETVVHNDDNCDSRTTNKNFKTTYLYMKADLFMNLVPNLLYSKRQW